MLTVVKAGLAKRTQVLRQNFMYVVVRGANWDRDPPGPNKKSRDGEFIFIFTTGQMRRSWHKKKKNSTVHQQGSAYGAVSIFTDLQ